MKNKKCRICGEDATVKTIWPDKYTTFECDYHAVTNSDMPQVKI